jgi:fructose-1-phosphate kinase PfkB-like protein
VQAEGLFNYPVRTYEDVIGSAQKLREGGAELVLISMAATDKAVLVADEGTWIVTLPDIVPGTRTGQAEAMIAGYLAGRLQEHSREESLGMAAAAAAYTVSQVGNEFPTPKDVRAFADQVNVTPVDEDNPLPDHPAEQPQN